MKKALAILLCAAMAMSFVACGTEKDNVQVQNSTNEIENSNIDASDSVAPITEDKSESDLIIGSWYDEENDCTFEFVDDKHVKLYLVGGTLDAEYLLSEGMMTISAGDENDKFDVVLEDSKLELMHQGDDFKYSFVRYESTVNKDFLSTSEKEFEICVVDDNTADIAVFNADDNSNWSIHFDDSFTLYYGDLGQGYECNLFRGNDLLDTFTCVNAQNAKIIHLETGYIDFNNILEYGFVDEDNDIYYGYAPTEVTVEKLSVSETADEDNKETESDSSHKETESDSSHNENLNETKNESEVNAILSQAAGHYVQGNNLGSVNLIDNGNGTYTLQDVNIYYTEVVELGPPSKMEDKEWHGASGSFGDGKGAESAGNGNVRVTLNLVGGNSKVVINKDGGMTIEWDGTVGPLKYDFVREY